MSEKNTKQIHVPPPLEHFPSAEAQELIREGVEKRDIVEEIKQETWRQIEDWDDDSILGNVPEVGDELWVTIQRPAHSTLRTKLKIKGIQHERLVHEGILPVLYILEATPQEKQRIGKALGFAEAGKFTMLYDPAIGTLYCSPLENNDQQKSFAMDVNRLIPYEGPRKGETKKEERPIQWDPVPKKILKRTKNYFPEDEEEEGIDKNT